MLRRFRPALAVLTVLATLALAAPAVVQAQALGKPDRADAEQALETVEQLTDGRAHGDKRELTPALAQLVPRRPGLAPADRRHANRILARPPDGGTQIGKWSAPAGDQRSFCSAHFCVRW